MASKPTPKRRPTAALTAGTPAVGATAAKGTRGAVRLESVLDAAMEIFHEKGYDATTVGDIAAASGILKGSLYYYIKTKEDLLFQIVADVHQDVQANLDKAMARGDLSALERLLSFAREQVTHNARNVRPIAVYHHDWSRLTGERHVEIKASRRRQEVAVTQLVEEAQAAGDVPRDLDSKLAAACVFATIIWPYTWYRPGRVSPVQLAEFCTTFVLNALTGTTRPQASPT